MADEITSRLKPQLLGRMTQRAVAEALRGRGPMSRADIARTTGISPTTVSSAVVQVLRAGLVEESDAAISGPGRPGKILRLAEAAAQVIGVSVEPEWCEMAVGGLAGTRRSDRNARFPTPNTYARLLAEIERVARGWIASDPAARTLGLGLSLPGVVDPSGDRAVYSPNLHQTDDCRPGRDLRDRLGVPTLVIQENDALCLAESRARGVADLAILDFTGGLGVGRLIGGKLLNRDVGIPVELGHVTTDAGGAMCGCGNRGCLETAATDAAFAREVSIIAGRPLTADEAFAFALANPGKTAEALNRTLDALAAAVAAVTNLFAPPLIVMYGRLLDLHPDLPGKLADLARPRKLAPFRDRCVLAKAATTKVDGALAGIVDRVFESLGPMLA